MPPTKLTEAFIRRLVYMDKPIVVRDTTVTGLMIAVHKKTKSYKVQRDLWVGEHGRRRKVKTVRRTLGTTQQLTLEYLGKNPSKKKLDAALKKWGVKKSGR